MFTKEDTNVAKGVALIMMYIHHMYFEKATYEAFTIDFFPINEAQALILSALCKICVAIFVFLSGYGLVIAYKKNQNASIKDYYRYNLGRYIKYILSFMIIFIVFDLVCTLSGNANNHTAVFGTGLTGIANMLLDLLGLSTIMGTPTFCATWWYNSIFVTILLLLPILWVLYRKIGVATLLMILVLPRMLVLNTSNLRWYLPSVVLGMIFADQKLFEKIHNWGRQDEYTENTRNYHTILNIVTALIIIIIFANLRRTWGVLIDLTDAVLAAAIIYISYETIGAFRITKKMIGFVGIHSMNLFLCHSFFRKFLFNKQMYFFENAWLNVLWMLGWTLLFSVILEWIKKIVRFNRLSDMIIELTRREQNCWSKLER